MEVHRQRCQTCGSMEVRNILVRDSVQSVYVRCAACGELVARYELKDYYHHGKGIESYLRAHGAKSGDSGRTWLRDFNASQKKAEEGYQAALEELKRRQKEI
ncbi:MAG: hypothetical protein AAGD07_00145 [Planctomycetota bacterium]